jgi:hypothetical protein
VLDRHLQPVPIGIPGELYIGGAGLTRGYLNRPELTAEALLPHPFSHEPGARLYKSGDLVRYLPNGNLEFFGRMDHQVKIRGFRIEPGEIEAVLGQHPSVRQTVVVAREDAPGDTRLVAYVVSRQELPPPSSALRSFLQQQLPSYMVPSTFVGLDALPLTPNGKIDRQALPPPERLHLGLAVDYLAPRSEVERLIATVWQEVLQVEQVGIHDNFFELGGHSLSMIRVQSRLQEVCKRPVSVVDMFRYPTISSLAQHLTQAQNEKSFQHIHTRVQLRKKAMEQ